MEGQRDVFALSSIHADKIAQVSTASGVAEKPLCVHDFNLTMGEVDFNDQMMKPYLASRRARQWYKKCLYIYKN